MSFLTKWNFILTSLFVTISCFLIWLSRWQRSSYSDSSRLAGVMLSMLVDHSQPSDRFGPVGFGACSSEHDSVQRVRFSHQPKQVQQKRHRFTPKQRHSIASLQDYRCFICDNRLDSDLKDTDIDHIHPLGLGGKDWPHLENLCALHAACHRRKTELERARARRY